MTYTSLTPNTEGLTIKHLFSNMQKVDFKDFDFEFDEELSLELDDRDATKEEESSDEDFNMEDLFEFPSRGSVHPDPVQPDPVHLDLVSVEVLEKQMASRWHWDEMKKDNLCYNYIAPRYIDGVAYPVHAKRYYRPVGEGGLPGLKEAEEVLRGLRGVDGVPRLCGHIEEEYLIMELINGPTLEDFMRQEEDLKKVWRVFLDIALILEDVHRREYSHGSLDSQSVVVERRPDGSNKPFLTNFGWAGSYFRGEASEEWCYGSYCEALLSTDYTCFCRMVLEFCTEHLENEKACAVRDVAQRCKELPLKSDSKFFCLCDLKIALRKPN